MNIALVGINARYIHTNLAIRYLYHSLRLDDLNAQIKEYTINQYEEEILKDLYLEQPDVIAFSCYIWNIEIIHRLGRQLKKILPETVIISGGPEVSFDTEEIMKNQDYIDIVIRGEAEESFAQLIEILARDEDYHACQGISFRAKGQIFSNPGNSYSLPLDELSFPYLGEIFNRNKIYYYESTRGCPYQCSYCLSSTIKGVRYASLEKVKRELQIFLDKKVKMVKFVDRTFNCCKSHALEIMQYLLEHHNGITIFHFEITAELLDEEMLSFFRKVPKGVFQFEAGIQSTNPETLKTIRRNIPFVRLYEPLHKVMKMDNIHLHLDLITGLPYEDYYTFRHSFNQVYSLGGDQLQLGFLKLLKGSELRERREEFGYVFDDKAPYEVLENKWINYGDLLRLKEIAHLLERYMNEHRFRRSLSYLIAEHYTENPFGFYEDFSEFWRNREYDRFAQSRDQLYRILLEYFEEKKFKDRNFFVNRLRLDYVIENKQRKILPELETFTTDEKRMFFSKEEAHEFLKEIQNRILYVPHYKDESTKKIMKNVEFLILEFPLADLESTVKPFKVNSSICVALIDVGYKNAFEIKQLKEAD